VAKKEVYACDVCGTERKDANHWFLAAEYTGAVATGSQENRTFGDDVLTQLAFCKWSASSKNPAVKHICGQVCAQKLLDEFLSK
jgi:hypothetical protein